jgi:hypothetical protein
MADCAIRCAASRQPPAGAGLRAITPANPLDRHSGEEPIADIQFNAGGMVTARPGPFAAGFLLAGHHRQQRVKFGQRSRSKKEEKLDAVSTRRSLAVGRQARQYLCRPGRDRTARWIEATIQVNAGQDPPISHVAEHDANAAGAIRQHRQLFMLRFRFDPGSPGQRVFA